LSPNLNHKSASRFGKNLVEVLAQTLLKLRSVLAVQQFEKKPLLLRATAGCGTKCGGWKGGWGPCLPFEAISRAVSRPHGFSNSESSDKQYAVRIQGVEAYGGMTLHRESKEPPKANVFGGFYFLWPIRFWNLASLSCYSVIRDSPFLDTASGAALCSNLETTRHCFLQA